MALVEYVLTALGLDRNELGTFLVQARLSGGRDHALASLLALNGLRISEVLGANMETPNTTADALVEAVAYGWEHRRTVADRG